MKTICIITDRSWTLLTMIFFFIKRKIYENQMIVILISWQLQLQLWEK